MKLTQLLKPDNQVSQFKLKGGKQIYTNAYMNGDRKKICVTRENGTIKRYVHPHKEIEIIQ